MITNQDIADLARRLATLLEDEEGRGMASWKTAVFNVGIELHAALGVALGEPMRGVQFGNRNVQTNNFS